MWINAYIHGLKLLHQWNISMAQNKERLIEGEPCCSPCDRRQPSTRWAFGADVTPVGEQIRKLEHLHQLCQGETTPGGFWQHQWVLTGFVGKFCPNHLTSILVRTQKTSGRGYWNGANLSLKMQSVMIAAFSFTSLLEVFVKMDVFLSLFTCLVSVLISNLNPQQERTLPYPRRKIRMLLLSDTQEQ